MTQVHRLNSRLLSLDVFRGITIVLMILVNSPGNHTAYAFLSHSIWNGCSLADLVFPFFLFIVGVSLVFSLSHSLQSGCSQSVLIQRTFKRAAILFLIGLFLNAFPRHFDFATLRVFGVLQRIAVCYFVASLLFLKTSLRTQIAVMLVLLVAYWLILTLVPVPGYGANHLTLDENLAGYLDRLVFTSDHLYEKIFDPEGFLSTLPAIATTLLGNLTGYALRASITQQQKLKLISLTGMLAMLTGWVWGLFFPINKALWTSSFVLWTGGIALIVLAACYWLIEIKHYQKWFRPFEIFGVNAIAAYFLHIFFLKIQGMIHLTKTDGTTENLRLFITEHLFSWTTSHNASLLYALCYILFWLGLLALLYRHKIFIKI